LVCRSRRRSCPTAGRPWENRWLATPSFNFRAENRQILNDARLTASADMTLLAAPNVSEGRDAGAIEAIARAFSSEDARLVDVHSDPDHNRSVFTLAGHPGQLVGAIVAGAREAVERIDMTGHRGVHPCVGALDVAPIVHPDERRLGAACAEALVVADELARQLQIPVLLYGALAGGRTRSELRRGGLPALARRLEEGALEPDFGPRRAHRTAGVTLVAARPALVAFNVELARGVTVEQARLVAGLVREGGAEGIPGVRAIGLWLDTRALAQVSFNVEQPEPGGLAELVEAVRRHAGVEGAELVGLAPAAAFDGFPDDVPLRGWDRSRQAIENVLG
jgi:glutamate formiminotransferase